jgi:SAM-dependent methyltransferase
MTTLTHRLARVRDDFLKVDLLRNYYCWLRYQLRKGRMKTLSTMTDGVGKYTIEHNMGALAGRAAFGMGNRMAILLYPLAAALRDNLNARVLIVGPRTEDDLFLARSLGMQNVRGLDLFSYSEMIDIGDMHATSYPPASYDAVVLGWVISYSTAPERLVEECKRILKPGGYLAFGIESNPEFRRTGVVRPPRVNPLNSGADIAKLVKLPIVFLHDPQLERPTDNGVVFQLPAQSPQQ